MTMARRKKIDAPKTAVQRLDSIVKSVSKIMRKDKGLNGELDRLPMLTWIMFLNSWTTWSGATRMRQQWRLEFCAGYRSTLPMARLGGPKDGLTGPDLIRFLSAEELVRPDGKKGAGLFAYLRGLRGRNGGRDRRDVIATVFRGLSNRMESGYLLRDVVNLINGIHFDSSDEVHTLSRLYEGLLREMRDAAATRASFTRRGASFGLWSRLLTRDWEKRCWTRLVAPGAFLARPICISRSRQTPLHNVDSSRMAHFGE